MKEKPIRHPLLQQNLLDKAIAYVAPKMAQQRMMARAQLALAGGYSGARRDRAQLSNWRPGTGSPTTDIIADLPELRGRSRDQMRNAPVAVGAINSAVSHIVGTGLACTPSIDFKRLGMAEEVAEAWCEDTRFRYETWATSTDCDLARNLNFYGIQSLAQRTWFESGDGFVLTPRVARAGRAAQLALQLIEADRVCNPDRKADTDTLIDGIELAEETGETLAVHVARKHPGDYRVTGNTWERVAVRGASTGRRNVLHLFEQLRPGQVRGVPWIAPILEPLKQLNRWTDNELNAAVTSSIFSVFVKMDAEAFNTLFNDDDQGSLLNTASEDRTKAQESGQAINLLPGEDITTASMNRPNPEFDPFWTAIVRQMGMALEVPYEVLVMHFQSSYSAARGALLMAWKFYKRRRDLLATQLCQPVYELWLADEVAEGRISAPGFFANPVVRAAWCKAIWTGDGPGSIDPQKEVAAARERVEMEISTLDAESMLHDGVDWKTKHAQRAREVAAQKRDGTYMPKAGAAPQPAQDAPANDTPGGDAPAKDTDEDGAADAGVTDALHGIHRKLDGLASQDRSIIINQGDTHVTLPEGCIQLEARVDVPATQVLVQQAPRQNARQIHKRNEAGDLVETITTYEAKP